MASDQETSLFLSLVLSLEMAAMQQMGKLLNPLTGKMERDLNQARSTIDLLNALKVRTQGNLSPDEERVFAQVLTELQLNFVDESEKGEEPSPAKAGAAATETEAPTAHAEAPAAEEETTTAETVAPPAETKETPATPENAPSLPEPPKKKRKKDKGKK
jgi:hypothetical protein